MSETLKEYLIALGFKVDDQSFRRFNEAVVKTTTTTMDLGSQVVATATAIEVAVVRVTQKFTDLYYASSRTGAGIANLQAAEYGYSRIGLTADKARGAIEGLARSMRSNPGIEGLVNQMGIKTRGRDTAEVLDDLITKLKGMPFYMAAQYGQLLGQSPDDLLMLFQRQEQMRKSAEDFRRRQKEAGIDAQAMGEKSKDFGNQLTHLASTFDILATRMAMSFLPTASKVIDVIDDLVEKFTSWDKQSGGWVVWWGTIATSALGVFIARAALVRIGLIKVAEAAAGASAALGGGLLGKIITGAIRVAGPIGWLLGMTEEANKGEKDIYDKNGRPTAYGNSLGAGGTGSGPKPGAGRAEVGQYIMSFMQGLGWSKEQAAGLTANAEKESGFNYRATGDGGRAYGLFQWHPDRQRAFEQWSGKNIRDASVDDQLRFVHHELTQGAEHQAGEILRRTRTAHGAGEAVSRFYERPANTEAEASSRGSAANRWFEARGAPPPGAGGGIVVTQKTDIHVNGSGDPKAAGAAVLEGQNRVNGDLVRNLGGVTR